VAVENLFAMNRGDFAANRGGAEIGLSREAWEEAGTQLQHGPGAKVTSNLDKRLARGMNGVVSVKFSKSGSVIRGFGEVRRFMGRV
jgi:hypothetical protein